MTPTANDLFEDWWKYNIEEGGLFDQIPHAMLVIYKNYASIVFEGGFQYGLVQGFNTANIMDCMQARQDGFAAGFDTGYIDGFEDGLDSADGLICVEDY